VYTGARKKHLGEIETIARAELTRIAAEPITSVELERARRYLATAEARADATNNSRIAGLASDLVEGRPLLSYDERIARLNAVTPADVQALARRLFQGKYFAVLTLY
jgi:zinc protease